MAKNYEQNVQNLVKLLTVFKMKVAIGAAGAPTLSAADSKGIVSIVRNSAGLYTVTFSELMYAFIGANIHQIAVAASGLKFEVAAVSIPNKTVQFRCVQDVLVVDFVGETSSLTATATDPASGDTILASFEFKQSSI